MSIHTGTAVTRKVPLRPAWAASKVSSAASNSSRMRRACAAAAAPSAVRRAPLGVRSKSWAPKRCSIRAMIRV